MVLPAGSAVHDVMRGRWLVLLASILIMAASGGTYVFGIYSKAIRASLGYDQKTLNMLSFFKTLGGSLGVAPGLLYEVAPTWVVLVLGGAMNLVGYLMIYLSVTKLIAGTPPVGLMCFYIAVGAASQSFATTGAVVSAVKTFPDNRGDVLGFLTGYGGLSGAVFTQLHRAFFHDDSNGAGLLLLLASLPAAISLVFASITRAVLVPPAAGNNDTIKRGFRALLYTSIVLSVGLLAMSMVQSFVNPNYTYYYLMAATVLLVVVVVVVLIVKVELHEIKAIVPSSSISVSTVRTTAAKNTPSGSGGVWPARGEDHSVRQALLSVDMLLIFAIAFCGISGQVTAMDNLAQIGESLGYDSVSLFISLANISSYAGRVVAGFGSELLLKRYKVPRPLVITVVLLVACVGHLIVAFGVRNGLYAASLFTGFSLGAQWTLLFAIVSELFGLKHFSTLYNLVPLAMTPGCYLLNLIVTGSLYDKEAQRQGGVRCIGVQCFKAPFLVVAGATVIAVSASLVLAWRTANYYYDTTVYVRNRSNDRAMHA